MTDDSLLSLYYFGELLVQILFVGFIVLRGARTPAAAMAWVVVVLALPVVVGIVLYLVVGEVRLGRRRVRRHAEIVARTREASRRTPSRAEPASLDERDRSIASLAERVGGTAPRAGNEVRLYGDTGEVVDALVSDVDAARRHCHLLFYIYLQDATGERVADALGAASRRGVDCRLLVDGVGSRDFLRSSLARRMREAGVRVVAALPAPLVRVAFQRLDVRNHRKLAVIDGEIGYTGSQNVADATYTPRRRTGPWVDTMLRIRGPVVRDLQEIFVEDWYLDADESLVELLEHEAPAVEGGIPVQITDTGPGANHEALRQTVQAAMHLAREELVMTTPYFVPDSGTFDALTTAAARGLRALLVVPHRNDSRLVGAASRSYYDQLLDAGVEVFHYTEGLLHAKTITVDRHLALVTTANMDRRSFELNYEVSTLVFDDDFAGRLRELQESYLDGSERIEPRRWRRRALSRRLVQNAARLLSPLL